MHIFTARCYASAVLAMGLQSVSVCVDCVCVCHKPVVIDKGPYWRTLHLMTPASTFNENSLILIHMEIAYTANLNTYTYITYLFNLYK